MENWIIVFGEWFSELSNVLDGITSLAILGNRGPELKVVRVCYLKLNCLKSVVGNVFF